MFTASKSRGGPALALAFLLVCWLPARALSDEIQYLPDDVRVIASVNVTTGAKTKTFQEFMKQMTAMMPAKEGEAIRKEQDEKVRDFASKISRITLGVGMPDGAKGEKATATEAIDIATAIKTITIDDAKALKTPSAMNFNFRKNYAFKEIKHGAVTIYQETYQTQFGKDAKLSDVIEGEAFYLAEGKYIVSSRKVPVLTKIIDRNKPATLSALMKAGLKDAGANNIVSLVVDIQNMPAEEKASIHKAFASFPGHADIKANIDKSQSLTVKINEPKGKFELSATLTCSDKASAAAVKTAADQALAFLKTKANEDPKVPLPAEFQKYITSARTTLKAIQLSSAGAKVTASLELEPEVTVQAMSGWFFIVPMGGESRPSEKAKVPEKLKDK